MSTYAGPEDMARELSSQPDIWRQAAAMLPADGLPERGAKVAVVGCGTSWFMAQSYAALRESRGFGVTDAFVASEAPLDREYDLVVGISRSGTTTEVIELFDDVRGRIPTLGIVGNPDSPLAADSDSAVVLPFADENSVVQTRFATGALALLRASLGDDLSAAIADAENVLERDVPDELVDAEQFTFLGRGWTIGLANEAALKMRESSQSWTESYPAMDYRHGPISIAQPGRVTWMIGEDVQGLAADIERTGALYVREPVDPMAALVRIHMVALARARARGLNADAPRGLTRSVILK
ncbi:SIS domain-containing protein [Spelaeicoccus albus]|uniref:Fructoselysine-6-P-deglycase FrlB-like protein n=1 Tax=Spelaeicoccus albus TaxID=1280376 RepID=A0A7Z0D195_9MICO|nr:SIS domain-containing protein [Spelaeicoccus albus]NYI65725.1 fructoselysine-6-P-deglycase FrlB-like protein [Spelaeicoccus albus]